MNCNSARIDVRLVVFLFCSALVCFGPLPLPAQAGDDAEFSARVLAATGKIRVEWRNMGEDFPMEGVAVCIHPEGYFVTSLDIVADPSKPRRGQRSSSRLIFMTYSPWGQGQQPFQVQVISEDRRRNFALLKVDLNAAAYLEVSKSNDLAKGDSIWVVENGRLRKGDVGEKERGSRNREIGFAIGLDVATGSMGSPVIDHRGEVVGIRTANTEGRRESRSVPARWLNDFLSREAVKINLDPAVVTDLAQPLRIRLDPVIVLGSVGGGRIEIQLAEQKTSALFSESGGGWETEITLPKLDSVAPEGAIEARVTLSLHDVDGHELWKRRVKVDVLSLGNERYQQEDGPALQEREVDLGRKSAGGAADPVVESRDKLADVAGSVSLKKNASGVAMIDNNAAQAAGDARPDPARYEGLEDKMHRSLAERFDIIAIEIGSKRNILNQMSGDPFSQEDDLIRWAVEIEELRIRRGKLVPQVQEALICQCSSRLWFPCAEVECNTNAFQSSLISFLEDAERIEKAREEATKRLMDDN